MCTDKTQVAIKHLKSTTSLGSFLLEYDALKMVERINHRNIVQTLQGFWYEENGVQSFSLIFLRAACSLKQLLRGDPVDLGVSEHYRSLWSQFQGLASALEHINIECKMAHQDIKPSKILLYVGTDDEGLELVAKVADFGLAAGLEGAKTYALGSRD
jgi:serine/threonine protein kinase